jgi:hypothetical protein
LGGEVCFRTVQGTGIIAVDWQVMSLQRSEKMKTNTYLVAVFLAVQLIPQLRADELDCWVWRNPRPHGIQINSLAYGGGLWTAYANGSGLIATSPDGANWDQLTLGTNATIYAGAHGNGRFVCATSRGAYHSFDAHNWFKASFFNINDVAFGNGLFVGPDGNATVWRSNNGSNWTSLALGAIDHYTRISFANGRFFATGSDSSFANYLLSSSTDGTNWGGSVALGTNAIDKIVFGNGVYLGISTVVVPTLSKFRTSVNGTTWSAPTIRSNYYVQDVIFANGQFVAIDLVGRVMFSADATNWTEISVPELYGASEIGWDGTQYVTSGYFNLFATSPDGTNWTQRGIGTSHSLLGITRANGFYVAVGGNLGDNGGNLSPCTVVTSTNARDWTIYLPDASNSLASVTFGNGTFVAVGAGGLIVKSTNAVNWNTNASPTASLLNAVAYGSGRFVAVGGDTNRATIISSTDGANWTDQPAATNYLALYGLTFAQNQFVAVGRTNGTKRATTLTSSDGLTWTAQISTASNHLRSVTYGNGSFVAVGDRGAIATSSDAVNWTNRSLPIVPSFLTTTYGNGNFLVFGNTLSYYTSTNTVDWVRRRTTEQVTIWSLYGAIYGDNTFLAVGSYGQILETVPFNAPPPVSSLALQPGNPPFLSITAPEWHGYEILTATSLPPVWETLNTVTNYSATTKLPVTPPANSSARFYRVRSLN